MDFSTACLRKSFCYIWLHNFKQNSQKLFNSYKYLVNLLLTWPGKWINVCFSKHKVVFLKKGSKRVLPLGQWYKSARLQQHLSLSWRPALTLCYLWTLADHLLGSKHKKTKVWLKMTVIFSYRNKNHNKSMKISKSDLSY